MAFLPLDPATAERVPNNATLLAVLRAQASPQSPEKGPPWVVGGFTVPTHPDLVERVSAVAGAAGLDFRFLYGFPCLVAVGGVVVAVANGTGTLSIRAANATTAAILASEGRVREEFGPGWLRFNPWRLGVAREEAIPLLARWCLAAAEAADSAEEPTGAPATKRPGEPSA